MSGEVVANQDQVVQRAWAGAQELQRLIDLHVDRQTDCLEDARDEKKILDSLRRRALSAAEYFSLTHDEAELLGSIADRSFFAEWRDDFAFEYGVAK